MRLSHGRGWKIGKRICILCMLAFLLAGSLSMAVRAENLQVTDMAGILEEEEIQSLKEEIIRLEEATGWDVMAATTEDAEGLDTRTFGELLFERNCTCDDGIVCLIDMGNREFRLLTFGQAIYYLTDSRIDDILDAAEERIHDQDYEGCLRAMVEGAERAYEQGIPEGQYTYDEDTGKIVRYRKPRRITWVEALVAIVAALAAGGITAAAILGKYRLKWGGYEYSCRENGRVDLEVSKDTLVNQVVTHRHIPKNPPKSSGTGGGSRSTVHRGGGGRVSGGGGRKF